MAATEDEIRQCGVYAIDCINLAKLLGHREIC